MGRDLGPTHCHLHIPLAKEVDGQTRIQGTGRSPPPTAVGSAAKSVTEGRDVELTRAGSEELGAVTQPLWTPSQLVYLGEAGNAKQKQVE